MQVHCCQSPCDEPEPDTNVCKLWIDEETHCYIHYLKDLAQQHSSTEKCYIDIQLRPHTLPHSCAQHLVICSPSGHNSATHALPTQHSRTTQQPHTRADCNGTHGLCTVHGATLLKCCSRICVC
jgi:hypothetical protein